MLQGNFACTSYPKCINPYNSDPDRLHSVGGPTFSTGGGGGRSGGFGDGETGEIKHRLLHWPLINL